MNLKAIIFVLCLACASLAPAQSTVRDGILKITAGELLPGNSLDLTGKWLYRPGYAIAAGEKPEAGPSGETFSVPVPQLLNRIRWWLDDSEDFNRHETERLKALGFDTDRAEDGWYYLKVNLPALPVDKHVFLEFEGVAMISRTYCNGQLLGEHKGMFSRFDYDLTPSLKAGENLIAVFVSMEKVPPASLSMGAAVTVNLTASKVKSMSKGMYGPLWPSTNNRDYDLHGIWQPVKLVVRGNAKLDGVWFNPSLDGATVRFEAHSFDGPRTAKIKEKFTDVKTGRVFAAPPASKIELHTNFVQFSYVLAGVHPKLWTPAEPNLYRLNVTLESENGKVLDSWSQKVGFRTFEVRGNKFYLNGHPYWLRGADHLPYGKNPFDPLLPRKLIQALHDNNIRVTRTHATPWNEIWLDAADEIGLGVSLEGIRPWALSGNIGPTPPDLFAHWLMENEDVVKRARNHPSVFIYTVGNEMLLRDTKNIEKWKQLSEVVKQTRRLDPTRPVICSSEYARDPQFYNDSLKPNGIDDGDADDLHRYNNWYAPSSFVTDAKFEKEVKNNGGTRPLMGQEMSTGYPDLDTGLPVYRYTHDLLTPQAWVGNYSYPGNDPAIFLEHHRAVTKRWAERLRFERGTNTAGFMLFATECWFSHSYDAATFKPYPVLDAVRDAFAPLGLALEIGRRHFFSGENLDTAVFISNDSDDFRDLPAAQLEVYLLDRASGKEIQHYKAADIAGVRYGETIRVPVQLEFPPAASRREMVLELRLLNKKKKISYTRDYIEVMPPAKKAGTDVLSVSLVFAGGLGPEITRFAIQNTTAAAPGGTAPQVWLIGPRDDFNSLKTEGGARAAVENGATAIVFSPGQKFSALFPSEIEDVRNAPGEYADFSPCAGTTLAEGLQPMDLKWWGRKDDWRVFVANTSHRLKAGSSARELIRYISPHGYIPEDKVKEQYRTVLFEIPLGKGRLWVCDLDLEASVSVDPLAQIFARNLLRAAADAHSTDKLPLGPSHEELSKRHP